MTAMSVGERVEKDASAPDFALLDQSLSYDGAINLDEVENANER